MTDLRGVFRRIGERIDVTGSRASAPRRPPRIDPYHGYANAHQAFVYGRLLSDAPVGEARDADPWWLNLLNTWRRMETDETPGIRLTVELGGSRAEAVSDNEGHFRARVPLAAPLATDRRWHDATVRVHVPAGVAWPEIAASAPVLVPADTAGFAIISDVDDTVIETHATRPIRMMREVLFENAHTRRPFPGVAAFYIRLERGANGRGPNPFFYLSSSPWNLHDVLVDFMMHNGVPIGPLLLKDWGLPERGMPRTSHREHKLARIDHLLGMYAGLRFVLIGDNGQADPTIYEETVARHPDRILALYIREVADDERRRQDLAGCAKRLATTGVPFFTFRESDEAAGHAAGIGLLE